MADRVKALEMEVEKLDESEFMLRALPEHMRNLADAEFAKLKANPNHPSLHLKRIGEAWSAGVGNHYRVIADRDEEGFVWFGSEAMRNMAAF